MGLADYEQLAARSFEDPGDDELRADVLVCADALSQAGDPRGALITMEQAMRDAPLPRASELARAMHQYAADHGPALLGSVASLMKDARALSLEWRSGMLYGISIDARYLPKRANLSAGELVKLVLRAPAAKSLRRLRVRVRNEAGAASVVSMLKKRKHPLPLEELEVGGRVWPTAIEATRYGPFVPDELLPKYPNLYYVALDDAIRPLPILDTKKPDRRELQAIASVDPPTRPTARRLLGRALTSADLELRNAALERVVQIGPRAAVYARLLSILLQPRVIADQLAVVKALEALGPSYAHALWLARVSSRSSRYDPAIRRAAGTAAASVRPRPT